MPCRHAGAGVVPAGKDVSPRDIVSKMSLSIAVTIACCAADHLPAVLMLALPWSTMSSAAGSCCAVALTLAHAPNGLPPSPPPVPVPLLVGNPLVLELALVGNPLVLVLMPPMPLVAEPLVGPLAPRPVALVPPAPVAPVPLAPVPPTRFLLLPAAQAASPTPPLSASTMPRP